MAAVRAKMAKKIPRFKNNNNFFLLNWEKVKKANLKNLNLIIFYVNRNLDLQKLKNS